MLRKAQRQLEHWAWSRLALNSLTRAGKCWCELAPRPHNPDTDHRRERHEPFSNISSARWAACRWVARIHTPAAMAICWARVEAEQTGGAMSPGVKLPSMAKPTRPGERWTPTALPTRRIGGACGLRLGTGALRTLPAHQLHHTKAPNRLPIGGFV